MIVVADASVLVAELLRARGRELFAHPDLRVVVAEEQWDETQHELQRRISAIVEQRVQKNTLFTPGRTQAFRRPVPEGPTHGRPRAVPAHLPVDRARRPG